MYYGDYELLKKGSEQKNLQKTRNIQKKCLTLQCDYENRMNNGNQAERVSQESECRNESESSLLARASAVAQGVLEEIEALAGTKASRSYFAGAVKETGV